MVLRALGGILGTFAAVDICNPRGTRIDVTSLIRYTLGVAMMLDFRVRYGGRWADSRE